MSRYILVHIFLILLCACGEREFPVTVNESEKTLGNLTDNECVTVKFTLVNNSADDIDILSIKPTVSYLRIVDKPMRIKANDSTEVQVKVFTEEIFGNFTGMIQLKYKGEKQVMELLISGSVIATGGDITQSCPYVFGDLMLNKDKWYIGDALIDREYRDTIRVYNPTDRSITIRPFTSGGVTCHIPFEQLNPGKASFIYLTYKATDMDQLGRKVEIIRFILSQESAPTPTFVVDANVKEDFAILNQSQMSKAPRVLLDSEELDFGTINAGETVLHKFMLTNQGQTPLIIRKVITSCGCTTLDLSKKVVAPGEVLPLDVLFKSGGRQGLQQKSITLITNDPTKSEIKLVIKGVVRV